jgi:hypothetical protein
MSPDERLAMQAIERRVALENQLEGKKLEWRLERLEEKRNPPRKIQMRSVLRELKGLRTMLPNKR